MLVSIVMFSCSKEDVVSFSKLEMSTCLNPYLFNTGSYWIYQDTASLQIDTTYVVSWQKTIYNGLGVGPDGGDGYREEITINYESTRRGSYSEFLQEDKIWDRNVTYFKCGSAVRDKLVILSGTYFNVVEVNTDDNRTFFYRESVGPIRIIDQEGVFDLVYHQVGFIQNPF